HVVSARLVTSARMLTHGGSGRRGTAMRQRLRKTPPGQIVGGNRRGQFQIFLARRAASASKVPFEADSVGNAAQIWIEIIPAACAAEPAFDHDPAQSVLSRKRSTLDQDALRQ